MERGCVRSTSRSRSETQALRLGLRPQPRPSNRRREQLDVVPVRVGHENLRCSVGSRFRRTKVDADIFQVCFPSKDVIHHQREMIVSTARFHGFVRAADEMKLLLRPQPEPRARKIKRRARHGFESQHTGIKLTAARHVRDVDGHMIQFDDLQLRHGSRAAHSKEAARVRDGNRGRLQAGCHDTVPCGREQICAFDSKGRRAAGPIQIHVGAGVRNRH